MSEEPLILKADQAAKLLGVPKSWVMAQARHNRIPHVRYGRYVRFHRDELLAWSLQRQQGPVTLKR